MDSIKIRFEKAISAVVKDYLGLKEEARIQTCTIKVDTENQPKIIDLNIILM